MAYRETIHHSTSVPHSFLIPKNCHRFLGKCPMWSLRSPRGSARWRRSCMTSWCCDYVGDNIGCWAVRLSLRWWWTSRTTGSCTRWERWSPMSGQRLNVLEMDLLFRFICRDDSSCMLNSLGPLCLWQCFNFQSNGTCVARTASFSPCSPK